MIRNNDVYNPDGVNYNGGTPGVGDISVDPVFADSHYGDFHIQLGSPCIGAGWNDAPGVGSFDKGDQPRVQPAGGIVDIGAYESDGTTWTAAGPVIVRVDAANGSDANDGSAWSQAKKTVQSGIDAAAELGGEVWAKAGVYNERIRLKSYAYLYGGFAGNELTRDARNWGLNKTVLDGGGLGSVVTASIGWHTCNVDGFTIQNGKAATGGGIYIISSAPDIANNIVFGNTASTRGGGLYCERSRPSISGNVIVSNVASQYGGGVSVTGYPCPVMSNNTITCNSSSTGGAIYLDSTAPQVSNNIIALNSSGIYAYSSGPTLRNNNVYNPDGSNYWGVSAGSGDISADPIFAGLQYGDYHIQPNSPCVNAGWNQASGICSIDIDGQARVQPSDGNVDIGVDESDGTNWPVPVPAVVVRVDGTNGDDANDGSSWTLGKKTVQSAINAASAVGGDVWVRSGNYNERINLKPYTYVYGGFAGNESTREARNWGVNKTVLDGGGLGSVVTASNIVGPMAIIDGFTIQNGRAANGGGISCSNASPSIVNNTITGNIATSYGGGIYCFGGAATPSNNIITGNSANTGGGIYCGGSCASTVMSNSITANTAQSGAGIGCSCSSGTVSMSNNLITGNRATSNGGGIYTYSSQSPSSSNYIVSNNSISSNSATGCGGGVCFDTATIATMTGNVVSGNSANSSSYYRGGGGVSCQWCGSITLSRNTMTGNSTRTGFGGAINMYYAGSPATISGNVVTMNCASTGGSAIFCYYSPSTISDNTVAENTGDGIYCYYSTVNLSNNLVAFNRVGVRNFGGSPVLRNNNVYNPTGTNYSSVAPGTGDISADPLFSGNTDYHLRAGSPCIDTGWNTATGIPVLDFDCQQRICNGTIDIGADEWWPWPMDAKTSEAGAPISLSAAIVSAAWPEFFYVESDDRSSGIRVEKQGHGLAAGMRADISGSATTNDDGERCISATSAVRNGSGKVEPLGMSNCTVGGGTYGFQSGTYGWVLVPDENGDFQRVWGQSGGLNNIGLLITTWGSVTYVDSSFFYVDDGSGLEDGSGCLGLKVYGVVPVAAGEDPIGRFVTVTGISSCEVSGSDLISVIRTRSSSDVQLIQ